MKWLGSDPASVESDNQSARALGNGHQTPSHMLRTAQVPEVFIL
jgi:hypothetical protein